MTTNLKRDFTKIMSGELTAAEKIAQLPPEIILRTCDSYREYGETRGREEYQQEAICRLLANGTPTAEIAIILCVKEELVKGAASQNGELISEYRKQLKGRRYRKAREKNR